MQFVDAAHHRQIVRPGDGLGAIDPRARHAHKRALAAHRQVFARPFDHRSSIGRAHRPGLLAKKSQVWPEREQRVAQWVAPNRAVSPIREPELKALVAAFSRRAAAARN